MVSKCFYFYFDGLGSPGQMWEIHLVTSLLAVGPSMHTRDVETGQELLRWNQQFVRRYFGEAVAKETVADGSNSVLAWVMLFSAAWSGPVRGMSLQNYSKPIFV